MENYKHNCVIDANGVYVDLVLVLLSDKGEPEVQGYTLHEGESIIDFAAPEIKKQAGDPGLVVPKWNGTQWIESATAEQLAALTLTLEQVRAIALGRIEGCTSAVIYAGADVTTSTTRGKHHYSFPDLAQTDINTMMTAIATGSETIFSYKADDEELNDYTADEIKVLSKALRQLCTVCTKYKELLKVWINRETSTTVLEQVHFGSRMPDDLMTAFSNYLTKFSIDPTPYIALVGG